MLPRAIRRDATSAVAEPGLKGGCHGLVAASYIVWPSKVQGSWSRLQSKQVALLETVTRVFPWKVMEIVSFEA